MYQPSLSLSQADAIPVRYVRFEFSGGAACRLVPTNNCGPYRLIAVHAQLISATFAKLAVNNVDYSANQPGLNLVRGLLLQRLA